MIDMWVSMKSYELNEATKIRATTGNMFEQSWVVKTMLE